MEKTHVIKNRFNGKIIFSFKCSSINLCIRIAIAFKKDLSGAALYRANLSEAKNIISIGWHGFQIFVQKEKTKIGCEYRSNDEWFKMDINTAVNLGINKDDFDGYKTLVSAALKILKG